MRYRFAIAASACAAALAIGAPAAVAFDCTVAKKPATAGAVGVIDETTGAFAPLKPNPGSEEQPHGSFIAFTDGEQTASTFIHFKGEVLPPVQEGGPQHDCDGKGLESLEVCFSG